MEVSFVTLSLARRAERFSDRTAVVDSSEERLYAPAETIHEVHEDRVSYAELSALATRAAEQLSALGLEASDVLCLVTRNRVVSLALFFACRRLGVTFAPISHWLTPATVTRPFEVIDPDLVVFEAAQRDLVRSIPFDRSATLSELEAADCNSEADVASHDTVTRDEADGPQVLFHGDGGRPVVGYSARTLEWNCISTAVTWGLSGDDVVPLVGPLSAPDGFVRVALALLYVGGTLLLDRAFDPGDTLTAIEAERATFLAGRTTALTDLAAESRFDDAAGSLERAVVEGSLSADVRDRYRDCSMSLARARGWLECPTALSQSFSTAADSGGVGRPVLDCRARLVDDDGTVLEGEAEGRLELSGPVVADGYVNTAGAADDEWDEPTTGQRSDETGHDNCRRFDDGWFHTGERFRRDGDGRYYPS
ncbi:class I adenylate-forming enzyme family protein [Natronorubrum thiooxidans]|uniref:Acyl-CoA synthetase (AMP-forming)/AMP-acid ligase II n=1 Tax=Natronorubrum thiooxidans TaxID=308853 RepID=A0A1N7EXS4_9EURY|nr:AMP-binding protein [Natronorubrum thiooxidans]SIR92908.1 Acyl-CoA synthetase (AMP-forming)/AMP-acid ligase II [Natronorubrum thiooxidans]